MFEGIAGHGFDDMVIGHAKQRTVDRCEPVLRDFRAARDENFAIASGTKIQFDEFSCTLAQSPADIVARNDKIVARSEEHTSELQSLMRRSYAFFCLKKKKNNQKESMRHQNNEKQIENKAIIQYGQEYENLYDTNLNPTQNKYTKEIS